MINDHLIETFSQVRFGLFAVIPGRLPGNHGEEVIDRLTTSVDEHIAEAYILRNVIHYKSVKGL